MNKRHGFQEIEHTADKEIEAWAPTFEELMIECAKGMISLMAIKPGSGAKVIRDLILPDIENEMTLVGFLGDLLQIMDVQHLVPTVYKISKSKGRKKVEMEMKKFLPGGREIKAVTHHNLRIIQKGYLLHTQVVFDV